MTTALAPCGSGCCKRHGRSLDTSRDFLRFKRNRHRAEVRVKAVRAVTIHEVDADDELASGVGLRLGIPFSEQQLVAHLEIAVILAKLETLDSGTDVGVVRGPDFQFMQQNASPFRSLRAVAPAALPHSERT